MLILSGASDSFTDCVFTTFGTYFPLPSHRRHSQPRDQGLSLPFFQASLPPSHIHLSTLQGHAKPTSHPPELVLNNFSTPLGLSLASLLGHLFLPPSTASRLTSQGYIGRQVVLCQNSRDFVFVRRYRYMFALKSHTLGKTSEKAKRKKVGLESMAPVGDGAEQADDTVKTRFQEMGPRMTLKMRWIRRGALGETGDEREKRERAEKADDRVEAVFGEPGEVGDGEVGGADVDMTEDGDDDDDDEEEEKARRALGLDEESEEAASSLPTLAPSSPSTTDNGITIDSPAAKPNKKPRKRTKPSHALLRPPPSTSPEPGYQESEPVPLPSKDGKKKEKSVLSTVGKTWHAGKGEGGVREAKKRREWGWEVRHSLSPLVMFRCTGPSLTSVSSLTSGTNRQRCKSREGNSSCSSRFRCTLLSSGCPSLRIEQSRAYSHCCCDCQGC